MVALLAESCRMIPTLLMKARFLAVVLSFCCLTTLSTNEAKAGGPYELQVQGSSAVGGSSTTIVGLRNKPIPVSVMGRARDVLVIFFPDGDWLAVELNYLFNDPSVSRTRPNQRMADGQTRCFFELYSNPVLNGALIVLYSQSGVPMDWDPVVIR
jgi:hypothetical protein